MVTWEAAALTARCLERLLPELGPHDEVIVVDNGSTDGTADHLAARWPRITLVRRAQNEGFAGGVEAGLRAAGAPWVLTLNNDAWPEPGALARLRHAAQGAPDDVAAVQPLLLFERAGPDVINSTGLRLMRHGGAIDRDVRRPRQATPAAGEVFGPTAGAALYRRAALESVRLPSGVFDPRFFMYFEDVDVGWRLQLRGWRTLFTPEPVFRHAFQASSTAHGADFVPRQCSRNRLRLLLRNASLRMLLTTARHTAGDLVWLTRRERSAGLTAWLRAFGEGLSERLAIGRLKQRSRASIERRWRASRRDDAGRTRGA